MDEEVLIESSPLYQHLKQLEQQNEGILDGCPVNKVQDVSHLHDTLMNPMAECSDSSHDRCFNFSEDILAIKRSMCHILLSSNNLLEEHYTYLKAFLESYHPELLSKQSDMPRSHKNKIWFLIHGMASGLCLYKARSAVKYFAAVSLIAHAAFPAMRRVLSSIATQDWSLTFNKIRQILEVFREEELLWKSIRSLYQEINLVARGAVLVNHQKIQYSDKSEDLTISIRRAAQLHLNTSISRLKDDLVYLSELIERTTLDGFGLTVPDVHTLCSCDMTSLQTSHRSLLLLESQWIVFVTMLLATQPDRKHTPQYILNLRGLSYPDYLRRALHFKQAMMDGKFERKKQSHRKDAVNVWSAQNQALHSLYLHARELLRLTKLTDDSTVMLSDALYSDIKQQISDCLVCLERAGKRKADSNTERTDRAAPTQPAGDSVHVTHHMTESEPITDQVFVTEAGDGNDESETCREDTQMDYEAKLRIEYEALLMRELRGVISELARERVEREQQLMKTGTQSEDLAKTTQQLVENRDIKALVKIAAEGINQQSENNCEDATSKTKTGSSSAPKYEYIKDEEHIMTPSPVDVRQIAQLVAARFTEQHGQEETYGSENSDSEPES